MVNLTLKSFFRILVVVSTVLFITTWAIPFFGAVLLSEEELKIYNIFGYKAILPLGETFFWVLLSFWVVIFVGLFLFIKIARTGFVIFLLFTLFLNLFLGWVVFTPIEATLHDIVVLLDGMIVVMIYFTPVSNEFR